VVIAGLENNRLPNVQEIRRKSVHNNECIAWMNRCGNWLRVRRISTGKEGYIPSSDVASNDDKSPTNFV